MSFLLLAFAAIDAALLLWTFAARLQPSLRLLLLQLMLLGMFYDNTVQGIGQWFAEASWYEAANVPRFVLHAAVLPFLTLFALSIMKDAGIGVAHKPWLWIAGGLCTAAALAWGLYHEVYTLDLKPISRYGVDKMTSVSSLPPIGTIATNILILPMAAAVWRVSGWSWFFLGSLFIFLLNGATGAQPWGFLVGNFAEVVFMLALLATHRRFLPAAQTSG